MQHLTYLSYDNIRINNFKKHAPFDALLFNNDIDIASLEEIIKEINLEITAGDKWGKISDELKLKCYKKHIFITEIKSTRVANRHKENNGSIILDTLLKDDYDLDTGDELCITKREELKATKFELKK